VKPALEHLSVPAPIAAEGQDTGPAALAMAAAALGDVEAAEIVDRIEPTRSSVSLALAGLRLGYHVRLATPGPGEVPAKPRAAGLVVVEPATSEDVHAALAARHPVIVSGPGDGPPFLLVLREDEDELVVDDPSVDERPLTWSWDRLAELLDADPAPCVLDIGPRTRADR